MAFKFLMVLSVLFLIALCVDGAYSKKLPSCNCLSKAVDRCGSGASIRARRCRNRSLRRCVRKTVKRLESSIHKKRVISTRPPKRTLNAYCNRVARRRCGTGEGKKACITQVKREVKQREIKFRTTVLKACACKSKLSVRCRTRLVGRRCSRRCVRRYNRCARRCLKRGCTIRAKLECVSHNKKTKCRRTVLRSCRRVNNLTVKKSYTVSHRTIVVRKIDLDRHWRSICQRIAIRKCGNGAHNKKCRANVRTIVQQKEKTFRKTALAKCACRTKISRRCRKNPNRRRCVRRLNRCKRSCLRRACRSRAKIACANKKGRRCRRVATRRCRRFHFKRVRKNRRNRKIRLIRKRLNKRRLRRYCRRVAIRRCRKVARKLRRSCRARVVKQIKRRERKFRTVALRRCACKSRLSVRCRTRLTGRRCSRRCVRRYNKCSRRCLKKAIRVRVARECKGKKRVRRCRRLRTRRYRRIHCRRVRRNRRRGGRKGRKGGRKHKKTQKKVRPFVHPAVVVPATPVHTTPAQPVVITRKEQVRVKEVKATIKTYNQLPTGVLESHCKSVAIAKCGEGESFRDCRRRVREETRNKEIVFRMSTIKSCKCDAESEANIGRSCAKVAFDCTNNCIEHACKLRSTLECEHNKDQTVCYSSHFEQCTRLHKNFDN